jgi:ketosteroid isomerase-like protein
MSFAMTLKRFIPFLLCLALFTACGRSDPQTALNAAVKDLQTALENKDANTVMTLLHPDFSAQQPEDNREWAKQTMSLMFLRYKNIKIIFLSQDNQIDSRVSNRAFTNADIALTGAEGLIPDSARHYRVKLEWRLLDKQWKLIRLQWE